MENLRFNYWIQHRRQILRCTPDDIETAQAARIDGLLTDELVHFKYRHQRSQHDDQYHAAHRQYQ